MFQWGIMATGKIARQFADTLPAVGGATLGAVGSRSSEGAEAFKAEYAGRFPGLRAYGSYEELVRDPQIAAVYVCTPNALHPASVRLCLEAGKHVLCEKPFAPTAAEAEELVRLARQKGLFLMEGMWIAQLPLIQKMRQLLAGGALGQLRHLRAEYGFIGSGVRLERKLSSQLAGGALMDVGCYTLAFARLALGGEPCGMQSLARLGETGTDLYSASILDYGQGRTALLTSTIGAVIPTEGYLCGTGGSLWLPNFQAAQKLVYRPQDGPEQVFEEPFASSGFEYEIRDAMECIAAGRTQSEYWSWADTLAIARQIDALHALWAL